MSGPASDRNASSAPAGGASRSVVDRLAALRSPSGAVRRVVMPAAVVLFVVTTVVAVRNLPDLPDDTQWWLLLVAVPPAVVAIWANAQEYALGARAHAHRVHVVETMRVSVLSTAANQLPIPGAALVKADALRRRGVRVRAAAAVVVAVGVVWVGTAGVFAGALIALTGEDLAFGWSILAAGAMAIAAGALLFGGTPTLSRGQLLVYALLVESLSVVSMAARYWLVLRAIGYPADLAQAALLASAAIVASAAGIFPGGLGLREALSAVVGPILGIPASVSAVAAALERLVALATVAVVAVLVVVFERRLASRQPAQQQDIEPTARRGMAS